MGRDQRQGKRIQGSSTAPAFGYSLPIERAWTFAAPAAPGRAAGEAVFERAQSSTADPRSGLVVRGVDALPDPC